LASPLLFCSRYERELERKEVNMRNSGFKKVVTVSCLGVALAFASNALALQIDYSNTSGSSINFDGNSHFSFSPGTDSFSVTSGSAQGLLGDISGQFTIGSITTVGAQSSADVSGSGELVIHDGTANLKATLTWVDIVQVGTGSTLNDLGTVNLSGISYNGSNADLLALAAAGSGINVLTFQFPTTVSLSDLASSSHSTSFSGSIFGPQVVSDGGMTVTLLGLALSGLALVRRTLVA
jgi:hypothetical protein